MHCDHRSWLPPYPSIYSLPSGNVPRRNGADSFRLCPGLLYNDVSGIWGQNARPAPRDGRVRSLISHPYNLG